MNIAFVRDLLTIPKAWSVSQDFLTKVVSSIFSLFLLFSYFFDQNAVDLNYHNDLSCQQRLPW